MPGKDKKSASPGATTRARSPLARAAGAVGAAFRRVRGGSPSPTPAEKGDKSDSKKNSQVSKQTSSVSDQSKATTQASADKKDNAASFSPPDRAGGKKVDPYDGKKVTLEELREKYKGQYTPPEIETYWNDCVAE